MSTIAGSNVWHLKGKHVEDSVNQDDTVLEAARAIPGWPWKLHAAFSTPFGFAR